MKKEVKQHVRPNISRLEKWRDEITTMRRLNWPNDKIAQWLHDEKAFKISGEAVRKFCKVRGIKKGQFKQRTIPKPLSPRSHRNPQKKPIFEYNDSGPIDIHGK